MIYDYILFTQYLFQIEYLISVHDVQCCSDKTDVEDPLQHCPSLIHGHHEANCCLRSSSRARILGQEQEIVKTNVSSSYHLQTTVDQYDVNFSQEPVSHLLNSYLSLDFSSMKIMSLEMGICDRFFFNRITGCIQSGLLSGAALGVLIMPGD